MRVELHKYHAHYALFLVLGIQNGKEVDHPDVRICLSWFLFFCTKHKHSIDISCSQSSILVVRCVNNEFDCTLNKAKNFIAQHSTRERGEK